MNIKKLSIGFSLSLLFVGFISCCEIEASKVALQITLEDIANIQKKMSLEEQKIKKENIKNSVNKFKELQKNEHYAELKSVVRAMIQAENDYVEAFKEYIKNENDIDLENLFVLHLKSVHIGSTCLINILDKINKTMELDRLFVLDLVLIESRSIIK